MPYPCTETEAAHHSSTSMVPHSPLVYGTDVSLTFTGPFPFTPSLGHSDTHTFSLWH
jgi:hypothetical protein